MSVSVDKLQGKKDVIGCFLYSVKFEFLEEWFVFFFVLNFSCCHWREILKFILPLISLSSVRLHVFLLVSDYIFCNICFARCLWSITEITCLEFSRSTFYLSVKFFFPSRLEVVVLAVTDSSLSSFYFFHFIIFYHPENTIKISSLA